MPQGGSTFVLELGPNLNSKNSKSRVCAHDFDHLGGWKKSTTAY